ncbi:MAG TPA: TetR/AcrR family transcriptional regulator [Ignavibacteria bacterium]|nr:TetR/AcrR family transcriptional regulator [Ignavibacteria bacterium]HMQ99688.1 TetR/AcrR family transcriptional regulator [Ignavibacteria bacterium]
MAEVTEKEKILYFTHAKFITEGFYKTTMDEIARDLQMSKKTIYKHFDSKEELLENVCGMRMNLMEEFLDEVANSDEDAITKFLKIIHKQKSMSMNCSPVWFRDLEIHAPHLSKEFAKVRQEKVTKIMSKLLEQGKKEKVVEHVPVDIIITALNGAIEAVTHADFVLNSKYSFHEAMRITAEIFFNGFLTELGKEKFSNTKKLFESVLHN